MSLSLLKSTGIVSAMTFISRILGFIRDVVIAQVFGAGIASDAFLVAFKIPNFMRRLFAEGSFSLAFVPVFSYYKTQRSEQELRQLSDEVAGTLAVILMLVTALGVLAAPILVWIFAPGFSSHADKFNLTIDMLRITFPYLLFISLTAFAGGMLNSFGRFIVPALTPVLLNITMIMAALWWAPYFSQPIIALAWGVFFAGLLQLLFQLPALYHIKLLPRLRWGWRSEGVQRILTLMIPTLFGASVAQISLFFDTLLASFLTHGSVTWLYYSDRLVELPLGVFGVALGTVILPKLSRDYASHSHQQFSHTLDWGLRWTLIIALPATVGLVILAGPILAALFQYGEFDAHDVEMTCHSLVALSLGLVSFIAVKVLAPGFYARQNTETPVRFAVIALVANMILNLILIFPLAHAGLALATSIASTLNALMLAIHLYRQRIYQPQWREWGHFLLRVLIANVALGGFLIAGSGELHEWLRASLSERILQLAFLMGGAAVIYVGGLWLIGIRPHHLLRQAA